MYILTPPFFRVFILCLTTTNLTRFPFKSVHKVRPFDSRNSENFDDLFLPAPWPLFKNR